MSHEMDSSTCSASSSPIDLERTRFRRTVNCLNILSVLLMWWFQEPFLGLAMVDPKSQYLHFSHHAPPLASQKVILCRRERHRAATSPSTSWSRRFPRWWFPWRISSRFLRRAFHLEAGKYGHQPRSSHRTSRTALHHVGSPLHTIHVYRSWQ